MICTCLISLGGKEKEDSHALALLFVLQIRSSREAGRAKYETRWRENEWECLGRIKPKELRCAPGRNSEWCGEGRKVRNVR